MNFGLHCAEARRQKNISQEELAEALGVSRQTVCKWETGATYPDIDKLCEIAAFLGVSTSYLLGEEGSAQPTEATEEPPTPAPAVASPEEKADVLCHFRRFAAMIGGATLLILLSVALSIPLMSATRMPLPALGVGLLLAGIFAAVILYVIAGIRHDAYQKEHNGNLLFSDAELHAEQRSFTAKIAVGLALIFIGVLLVVVLAFFEKEGLVILGVSGMLALIGIACYLFITAGIRRDLYTDPKKALQSEEEQKRHQKPEDAIGGIIMSLATVVFLLLGFAFDLWHPAWVAFPIGGVLCGCVSSIVKLSRGDRAEEDKDDE